MQSIKDYLQKIKEQLSVMEDYLENCKSVPFSNRVSVDKHDLYDIIDVINPIVEDITNNLPDEIKKAKRIISDGDKIIVDAKNKASLIIKTAQDDAQKLVEDHQIIKLATDEASKIVEESRKYSRDYRRGIVEYADEILKDVEMSVRDSMQVFTDQANGTHEFYTNQIAKLIEARKAVRDPRENPDLQENNDTKER